MQLIYRGETYHYDRTQAKTETSQTPQAAYDLIYRGSLYHVDPNLARPVSTKPRSYELTYRGCTYQVTRNEAGEMIAMQPRQASPANRYVKASI